LKCLDDDEAAAGSSILAGVRAVVDREHVKRIRASAAEDDAKITGAQPQLPSVYSFQRNHIPRPGAGVEGEFEENHAGMFEFDSAKVALGLFGRLKRRHPDQAQTPA
jgi:hypothetical protein